MYSNVSKRFQPRDCAAEHVYVCSYYHLGVYVYSSTQMQSYASLQDRHKIWLPRVVELYGGVLAVVHVYMYIHIYMMSLYCLYMYTYIRSSY